jgi:alkylated DNA repair protein (DNA oxidative demethylase)
MQQDLFTAQESEAGTAAWHSVPLAEGAVLLKGHALARAEALLAAVAQVERAAPWRHMVTPGGLSMSVAMSNCGRLGWVSDRRGYRYADHDPLSGRPWPAMPGVFMTLAQEAARDAGFAGFVPDACLINRYVPGTKLSLHQDKDEKDFSAPIVSVSLGLPAVFVLGGLQRKDPAQRVPIGHGDVVVWGGPSRLRHHAVLPIKDGLHPATGACRINLTFRKAS